MFPKLSRLYQHGKRFPVDATATLPEAILINWDHTKEHLQKQYASSWAQYFLGSISLRVSQGSVRGAGLVCTLTGVASISLRFYCVGNVR